MDFDKSETILEMSNGNENKDKSIPLETVKIDQIENKVKSFASLSSNDERNKLDIVIDRVGVTVEPKKGFKKQEPIKILHKVTARFKPNTMTAVMGSSGSGKTTLLNVLAGRINGKISGKFYVNGEDAGKKIRKSSAYVMQQDILLSNLTVGETLTYAAKLRLPKTTTDEKKEQIIQEVLQTLNIESCRDTLVGGESKKGISGGQKKRVSIGQELLTDPSVIFLDEPTSGLDSATTINLIKSLSDFAQQGRTIISTIHQPSSETFFKFDNLLLLANGHQIYFGPTTEVVSYFEKLGYKCPQYENPADFILNLTTSGYSLERNGKLVESSEITKHLIESFENNEENFNCSSFIEESKKTTKFEKDKKSEQLSQFSKYLILVERNFKQTIREPSTSFAKLFQNIFFAILVGLVYLNVSDTQLGIQDRNGVLFFVVINSIMNNLIGTLYLFPKDRLLYLREQSTNCYGVLAYYFARMTSNIPFQVLFPLIFSSILYFMVGLQSQAGKFFIFTIANIVLTHCAVSMATAITAGVGTFEIALIFAPTIFIPLMLFGGFFVATASIPKYFIWVKYISPFKYGFELLAENEYSGLILKCTSSELVNGVCPITTGEQELDILTESISSIWFSFLMLVVISVVCHILAIIFLKISSKKPEA